MSQAVKVLIAEDHFMTREGLRRLLEEQDNVVVVGCAANPVEAMQLAQRTRPDVLVTDIRMPPTNTTEGIDLAHDVREMLPGCGVVVPSQHDDEEYVWALFADGVAGYAYLHKLRMGDAEQLVRAIHEVASGGSVLDPPIVQQLLAHRADKPGSPLTQLSEGELDVLRLMAEGYSNAGIGRATRLATGTVEKRIATVFMKLGLTEREDVNRRVRAVLLYLRESGTER